MRIEVGCAGWPVSKSKYLKKLRFVEIQTVFYNFPQMRTVRKWRLETGPDFSFALKASQLITHPPKSPTYRKARLSIDPSRFKRYGYFTPSKEVFEAWEKTVEIGLALEAEMVVFQTPASFAAQRNWEENIRAFFGSIDRMGLRLGWEPRGEFPPGAVAKVIKELGLLHITDPTRFRWIGGPVAYFRLHGKTGNYTYSYSRKELEQLARDLPVSKRVFVVFNNTDMFANALEFRSIVEKRFGR